MIFSLVSVLIGLGPHSWATKVCPAYPWNSSLRDLASQSEWIVTGVIEKEVSEGAKIKYRIKVKEVLKGMLLTKGFETKLFVKSKTKSRVSRNKKCEPTANLELDKEFIFFSENRNSSSIMEATDENEKLIKDMLGSQP